MWNRRRPPRAGADSNFSRHRSYSVLLLTLTLLACQADRAIAPDSGSREAAGAAGTGSGENLSGITTVPTEGGACPACAFGPRLYTRNTGQPVTDAATFAGNPAGAYIIEIDDLGTQGANATVVLNGVSIDARSGFLRKEISLQTTNQLMTRLTGKPGSKLTVSIFQEVHSVTVTPNRDYTRIHATQQFTAVARDRNGVVIPGQTFEWSSSNTSIATINASGLGTTTGAVHNNVQWTYETISTGEGTAQISARAIASTVTGSVPWRIFSGFVYTTFRAPRPFGPNRHLRPAAQPFRYSVARLDPMEATCASEHAVTDRIEYAGGMGLFFQCYPVLEMTTSVRYPLPFGLFIDEDVPNVGLYGRYCGAGHPGGDFIVLARGPGYQPKDPIDAMCMEHDRQEENHDLSTESVAESILALCIVRWGIESETLHEDGVLVTPGSVRWLAFWLERPEMLQARLHFLAASTATCQDGDVTVGGVTIPSVYSQFLLARGLGVP